MRRSGPWRAWRPWSARCPWAIEVQLQDGPAGTGTARSELLTERAGEMVEDEAERLQLIDGRIQLRLCPQPLHRPAGSQRSAIQAAGEVVQLAAQRPEAGHDRGARQCSEVADAAQPEEREATLQLWRRQEPDGERRQEGRFLGRAADRDGHQRGGLTGHRRRHAGPEPGVADAGSGRHGQERSHGRPGTCGERRLVAPQSVEAFDAEEGPAEGRPRSGRSRPRYPA